MANPLSLCACPHTPPAACLLDPSPPACHTLCPPPPPQAAPRPPAHPTPFLAPFPLFVSMRMCLLWVSHTPCPPPQSPAAHPRCRAGAGSRSRRRRPEDRGQHGANAFECQIGGSGRGGAAMGARRGSRAACAPTRRPHTGLMAVQQQQVQRQQMCLRGELDPPRASAGWHCPRSGAPWEPCPRLAVVGM